jgi:hypothetical protein
VSSSYNSSDIGNQPGATFINVSSSGNIFGRDLGTGKNVLNSFYSYLAFGTSDAGRILAHEFGHVLKINENPAAFSSFINENGNFNCQDPANASNPYVKAANDLEQDFLKNR